MVSGRSVLGSLRINETLEVRPGERKGTVAKAKAGQEIRASTSDGQHRTSDSPERVGGPRGESDEAVKGGHRNGRERGPVEKGDRRCDRRLEENWCPERGLVIDSVRQQAPPRIGVIRRGRYWRHSEYFENWGGPQRGPRKRPS